MLCGGAGPVSGSGYRVADGFLVLELMARPAADYRAQATLSRKGSRHGETPPQVVHHWADVPLAPGHR
jgi:hypothetical protein